MSLTGLVFASTDWNSEIFVGEKQTPDRMSLFVCNCISKYVLTLRLAPVVVLDKTGVTLCTYALRFWLPSELVEARLLIVLVKGWLLITLVKGWLLIVLVEAWLPMVREEV